MIDSLHQRGLPVVVLAAAALALVLFFLRPTSLAEGLLGVAFGILATWSAAVAVLLALARWVARSGQLPDRPAATVLGRVVAAVVLVGLVMSVETDPGARALVASVGPGLGLIMSVAALWFHRKAAAEPAAAD